MRNSNDLHDAIAANDLDRVKKIVEDGEDRHSLNCPLFQAASLGHTEICRYLLGRGKLDVDEGDDETGFTPLMAACENGHEEVAALLIKHGAHVNRQYEKEVESDEPWGSGQELGYPITLATGNGHAGIARLLLENGARPDNVRSGCDGRDNAEETPLLVALKQGELEIASLLFSHCADPNAECLLDGESCTPLTYSIAKANIEQVRWLLDHGADPRVLVHIGDMGKANALMYAVHVGLSTENRVEERFKIVEMLLRTGVDLGCIFEAWDGKTVIDIVNESRNDRYRQLFGLPPCTIDES